jgi:hypothetical protein
MLNGDFERNREFVSYLPYHNPCERMDSQKGRHPWCCIQRNVCLLPLCNCSRNALAERIRRPEGLGNGGWHRVWCSVITLTGFAVLIVSAKFGTAAMFLVGIPAVLVASAMAGGARSPTKIPLRDAILYVGISVAIVVGIVVYAMYHH